MTLAEALAKKSAKKPGIVITPEVSRKELTATIEQTLQAVRPISAPPPKASSPTRQPMEEARELGATEPGERIPMQHDQWSLLLHSPATSLCIVLDPKTPTAWLAIANPNESPLLIMNLPLHNKAHASNPF
jgi:hypothetical protein